MDNKIFMDSTVRKLVDNYLKRIDALEGVDEFSVKRNYHILTMLSWFTKNSSVVDANLKVSAKHYKEPFAKELTSNSMLDDELNIVFAYCMCFGMEYYINSPYSMDECIQLAKDFFEQHSEEFDFFSRSITIKALSFTSSAVIKDLLNDEDFKTIREFASKTRYAEQLKESWDRELSEKEKRVDILKDTLDKYEEAFNFIGLHEGFVELGKIKKKELHWSKVALFGLGALIPLSIASISWLFFHFDIKLEKAFDLVKITPAASITIFLFYYFRISLVNYNSIKAQIIQIELRKNLCRFIQSYAEHSLRLKTEKINHLEKFEDIIFSNIMTTGDKMPSTFDGLEQIASFVSRLKDKK
ncbi:hypothetical protein CI789_06680 [Erwinia persicina]|uniref:hypothetical protein n=1 Tax=Erwinia persicina TaxID=55211 RepID=UPI000E4F73F4|nr:hypothetical protein [Erwinia persicina]AXU94938.1 hypothetical protein CI789_06680 [Erwinia persicina]